MWGCSDKIKVVKIDIGKFTAVSETILNRIQSDNRVKSEIRK